MNFWDLVFPPKCIACEEVLDTVEKRLRRKGADVLCPGCRAEFEKEKLKKCRYCSASMLDCLCRVPALYNAGCEDLLKLCRYSKDEQRALKSLIFCLKRNRDVRCERFMATQLSYIVSAYLSEKNCGEWFITSVPRGKKAKIRYGYDHAERLARRVAKLCGIEYVSVLGRSNRSREQKYLGYVDRMSNVKGTFALKNAAMARGNNFIILDDVVTSGASMSECVRLLLEGGAARAVGACIAVAGK